MRRVLVVLLLVVLVGCLGLPLVGAYTSQIGLTSCGGYSSTAYSGWMYIAKFSTSGLVYGTYDIVNGSFGGWNLGWTKLVVMDESRHILAISDPVQATTSGLYNVTFSGSPTISIAGQYVGLGLISASSGTYYYFSGSANTVDSSNSYENPSDPSDVSYSGSLIEMYITVTTSTGAPTPTPSPSPVPTATVPPFHPPSVTPPSGGGGVSPSPSGFNTDDFGSSFYWIFLVLGSVVAFMFGLFALLGDKGNKAVNVLIAVISLVVFVVVLFAIGVL